MNKSVGIMYTYLQTSLNGRDNILKESIESIKKQTHENWLCSIIVEKGLGCPDSEILEAIGDDSRFIFIPGMQALGYGDCRNAASSLLGDVEYLTSLDSCDKFKPEHLRKRVALFSTNPEIDYSYGLMDIVGDPYVIDMYDKTSRISVIGETSQGPTIFVKKAVFDYFGGYSNMYGADGDLLYRIKESRKCKVVRLEKDYYKTYVAYRPHQE